MLLPLTTDTEPMNARAAPTPTKAATATASKNRQGSLLQRFFPTFQTCLISDARFFRKFLAVLKSSSSRGNEAELSFGAESASLPRRLRSFTPHWNWPWAVPLLGKAACKISLTCQNPAEVKNAFENTSSYRRNEGISAQIGFNPSLTLKKPLCALVLVCMTAFSWTAEVPSPPATPEQPPEIGLEELMKMEIPIVEAASKYRQKITEAPASVTVITADEVMRYGYETLADILASAPGLYVTYDRNYSFLGVRGFNRGDYNSRVELLIDGHRINNSLSDGAAIGTDFILDVDLIDRVEIIRGPGSSLYGNNAFFGVINVVTRQGRDMAGNGVEVSGEAGSFDSYKGRFTYGKRFKNEIELMLSGSIYDSQGHERLFYKEFNQPTHNNGIAQNADDDAFKSVFGSVAFHDFSLEG